jgi:hypothetical protein
MGLTCKVRHRDMHFQKDNAHLAGQAYLQMKI